MKRAESESFGSEHDPYGPAAYEESSPPRRHASEIDSAVLYDVPLGLEFEGLPRLEDDNGLQRGTGIRRLRRFMKFTKVVSLVAVAFLVAVLLVTIPKAKQKEAPNIDVQEVSPPVAQGLGPSCNDRFEECVGDRISHSELLETGDAICSTDHHYELGMDVNGTLVWQDCLTKEYKEYYRGESGYSFEMDRSGDFIVKDEFGDVKKKWDFTADIMPTKSCFQTGSGHTYDCPFLHIHKMPGRVVLNWEDTVGEWHSRGILRLFDFE